MIEQVYDSELLLSHLPEIIDNRVDKDKKFDELKTKIEQRNFRFGIHSETDYCRNVIRML